MTPVCDLCGPCLDIITHQLAKGALSLYDRAGIFERKMFGGKLICYSTDRE